MAKEIQHDALATAICEAFGLDPMKIKAVDLHMRTSGTPTLFFEYRGVIEGMPFSEERKASVREILKHYKLVPIEEEAQEVMSVSRGGLSDFMYSTTLLGIPLAELFGDERFANLLRDILRERQQNPNDWAILRRKERM